MGGSPHFVTYTLPSHNPPNTQTIPVSTTQDLGIVLNTRLSAEDNVVGAANKARRMLLFLKRFFTTITLRIFLPFYTIYFRPHIEYAIQASNPILSRDAEALVKVQKLALMFMKELRHVPYEAPLQQLRIFHQQKCCTRRSQYAFTIRAVPFWNKPPADIVNASSGNPSKHTWTLIGSPYSLKYPKNPPLPTT